MEQLLDKYEERQIALALHLNFISLDDINILQNIDPENMSQGEEEFVNDFIETVDYCIESEQDKYDVISI